MINMLLFAALLTFSTSLFHLTSVGNGVKRVFASLSQTTIQSAVSLFPIASGEGSSYIDNSNVKPFFMQARATMLINNYFADNLPQYFWVKTEYQVDCIFSKFQASYTSPSNYTQDLYPQKLTISFLCPIDGFYIYSDSKTFSILEN